MIAAGYFVASGCAALGAGAPAFTQAGCTELTPAFSFEAVKSTAEQSTAVVSILNPAAARAGMELALAAAARGRPIATLRSYTCLALSWDRDICSAARPAMALLARPRPEAARAAGAAVLPMCAPYSAAACPKSAAGMLSATAMVKQVRIRVFMKHSPYSTVPQAGDEITILDSHREAQNSLWIVS